MPNLSAPARDGRHLDLLFLLTICVRHDVCLWPHGFPIHMELGSLAWHLQQNQHVHLIHW